jgi:predicted glycosyltransferase
MPEQQQRQLQQRAICSGAIVLEFTSDLISYLNAATVVVSMGGYNTIGEILTLGKRAIVVPRLQPVAEQWIRADRMEKLGWLRMLPPQQLTPAGLMEAVQQELALSGVPRAIAHPPDLNALPRIADHLVQLLQSPSIDPPYFPPHSPLEVVTR